MKIGVRTPNLKKSIKARTTGKMKRAVKKSVNPLYDQKGVGYINNPKKAVYNKIYDKTTVDAVPRSFSSTSTSSSVISKEKAKNYEKQIPVDDNRAIIEEPVEKREGVIFLLLSVLFYILFIAFTIFIINAMMKYPLARKTPINYITMVVLLSLAIIFQKIYKGFNNK